MNFRMKYESFLNWYISDLFTVLIKNRGYYSVKCLGLSFLPQPYSPSFINLFFQADSIVIGDSVASLCLLRNIRVLNVSRSEFGDRGLCEISKALHFLEFLDASETKITDISSISAWSGTLHGLKLYAVELRDLFQSAKVKYLHIYVI